MCSIASERAKRARRKSKPRRPIATAEPVLHVTLADGSRVPLDGARLEADRRGGLRRARRRRAPSRSSTKRRRNLYDGISAERAGTRARSWPRGRWSSRSRTTPMSAPGCCSTSCAREALSYRARHADQAHPRPRWRTATRDYFPAYVKTGIAAELLDPELGTLRPRAARRRAEAGARPAIPVPRPADAVRPLLPACARQPHRAAAGLLHAGRDGAGAARDRPRGARDRVLRPAVVLRLHGLDADAVQRRHAAAAAVVLLPHHRRRRPRRHLQVDQGQRAARQILRRAR